MRERSLVRIMAAGIPGRLKASGMGQVTDVRPLLGMVRESFPGAWQRNMTIEATPGLASYSPVYACVTRISSDIATLGLDLVVDDGTGICDPAPKTSPFWPVLRKPNNFQTRIQFMRQWLISKYLFGNTYVLKSRDMRGIVTDLYVLDARGVQPVVTPAGDVYYSISSDQLAGIPNGLRYCPASEIIHDRGPTLWHPLVGVPPLYACALSGTLGLRIQQNAATFFTNMSRPSGMLTAPGTIDEVTAVRIKDEWEKNYSAANLGRLAVMGDGLQYQAMTIAAEQSQLVEQLGLTAIDVATAFGMPAYKINQGPMPTNNNVQALNQQYYNDCLRGAIEDIELLLDEGLSVPDGYGVVFDIDGLLRMDSLTQMDVLVKGVAGGILKPNEARAKLNQRGVTGGDAVYLQQQNFSLDALAKRDALPNPFVVDTPTSTPTPAVDPEPAKPVSREAEYLPKVLDNAERVGAAEESRRVAETEAAEARASETAARREADQAIARAQQAEQRTKELEVAVALKTVVPEAPNLEALAAELIEAFSEHGD